MTTIICLMLILIGLSMLFMYKIEKKVDELEKKMNTFNKIIMHLSDNNALIAKYNAELEEKDDKVLDLLTRTLDNVQENAESAKSAMQVCVDILSAVKGDTNE